MGINPKTGEKVNIPAKKVVKFRAAKPLKEAVKQQFLKSQKDTLLKIAPVLNQGQF